MHIPLVARFAWSETFCIFFYWPHTGRRAHFLNCFLIGRISKLSAVRTLSMTMARILWWHTAIGANKIQPNFISNWSDCICPIYAEIVQSTREKSGSLKIEKTLSRPNGLKNPHAIPSIERFGEFCDFALISIFICENILFFVRFNGLHIINSNRNSKLRKKDPKKIYTKRI